VHDAAPLRFPETYPRNGLRFHRRALRAVARRADLVITVSQAAAAELTELTAIPPERIRVVPHGVAVPSPPVGDEERAALAARGLLGVPYVLWVGSLEPRKNVGTLVAAAAELCRRRAGGRPPWRLVLAGYRGWLHDDLISERDRVTLGAALVEVGPVSDTELWTLYRHARVFAFPSRHEGFGFPLIEAMACGTAVVCSDLAVLREVGGDVPRYVAACDAGAWADAIDELLTDEAGRADAAARGAARAARFSVDAAVRATRAVYAEAVGGAAGG